jgi:hypothetical protein
MNIRHDLLRKIQNGKYPFNNTSPYKENSINYLNTEFNRCKDLFEKRITIPDNLSSNELNFLIYNLWIEITSEIENIECEHKEELEILAIKTIKNLYDIPEHILLNVDLETFEGTCESEFKDEEFELNTENENHYHKLQNEIDKQIILNGLIQGSSIKVWSSIYFLIKDEINQINPLLIDLYDKYSALTSISFWINPIDAMVQEINHGHPMSQGSCQVVDETTIQATGNNLPVMLHELNKGAITYLTLHGLPQNVTDQEMGYILSESNKYYFEIWHYLLSPTLWADFLKTVATDSSNLPKIIMDLSKMSYGEICEFFK